LITGSIWQFTDARQVTGSFSLVWTRDDVTTDLGTLHLTSSDGQRFSSSVISLFNDNFVHIAAGLKTNSQPFIQVRTIDSDILNFSGSYTGSTAFSGVFTGSRYDLIVGASSGSYQQYFTKGYFSQIKLWNRQLSSSEIDAHALHFESVGIEDPNEFPKPLVGYWPLYENLSASSAGTFNPVLDFSLNGLTGSGVGFVSSVKPYRKFLLPYNYLSPSVDLKWTENKIRIRDSSFLKRSQIATDTNEVSLEFNFVDALNEDIMKIFSTFDILNSAIGNPINKYRDEYVELEAYRRSYFQKLGENLNFNNFFNLFAWFDKKISDSIKQLLPTRVQFVGGEQVVESHFLERPRYKYQYPVFRTPVDIPDIDILKATSFSGSLMKYYENSTSVVGTSVNTERELEIARTNRKTERDLNIKPRDCLIIIKGDLLTK
jgi:hypothetical protein